MLKIKTESVDLWNDLTEEFLTAKPTELTIEHSLVSIAKWESRWNVPFLSNTSKTEEQLIDYIRCMTITQNVNPACYYGISQSTMKQIDAYITAPMSAVTLKDSKEKVRQEGESRRKNSNNTMTAEDIYWQMIQYNIPIQFEKWHINRLFALLQVCGEKAEEQNREADRKYGGKRKQMNRSALQNRDAINAARRKALHTKG